MTMLNHRRSFTVLALAGVAVFSLTACAPEAPAPKPSASASVDPSPSASAAPNGDLPPITELILTTEGLGSGGAGDLVFGVAPPSDDPSTALVSYDDDACAGTDAPEPGLWLANYPEADEGFGPARPFAIAVQDDLLTRIDINSSNILTDEGLALGSSLDAVLGTYPGGPDEVYNHADVSDVYVFMGDKGKLMFEIAVDRIPDYWEDSALNTVVFLSAVSIDIPAYGVAASDNIVGVCHVG
jgi:hypothetical protein